MNKTTLLTAIPLLARQGCGRDSPQATTANQPPVIRELAVAQLYAVAGSGAPTLTDRLALPGSRTPGKAVFDASARLLFLSRSDDGMRVFAIDAAGSR